MNADNRALRLLHVAQPPHGGVAEHIRVAAIGLAERGQIPEVAVSADNRAIGDLEAAGIKVHKINLQPGIFPPHRADLTVERELRALISDGGFDVVHAHGAKAGVLARTAAFRARVPSVYTAHGWAFKEYPFRDPPPPRVHRVATVGSERLLAKITRYIVCVAEYEKRVALERHIGNDRTLTVVRHGVTLLPPSPPDPAMEEFKAGGVLFGTVAVRRPEKGHHVLVDAIARVLPELDPAVRFAMVGEGDERAALQAQIDRLEIGHRTRIFDYSGAVGPHLAALDVFLLPSHQFEAAPIGIVEAMAQGLPVIGTEVGGVPEIVAPEAGLVVAPDSAEQLADAIKRLAADAEMRTSLGAGARRRVELEFTIDHEIDELLDLYRSSVER